MIFGDSLQVLASQAEREGLRPSDRHGWVRETGSDPAQGNRHTVNPIPPAPNQDRRTVPRMRNPATSR